MEKKITAIITVYLLIGLVFASLFAFYYRWGLLSLFSPGFYAVLLSWPFQFLGFLSDFMTYGLAGKPVI